MKPRHIRPLKVVHPTARALHRKVLGTLQLTKAVEFKLHRPNARRVAVAGTFNHWNPEKTPLSRTSDGNWKSTLCLKPGRYEYRFVVDGQWLSDPNAQESVPNGFGSTNSVVEI